MSEARRSLPSLAAAEGVAASAVSLMTEAAVSPLPPFYRLFFDYLAGADEATAMRLDGILQGSRRDGAALSEVLAEEFVRPYEATYLLETIAPRLEEKAGALRTLLGGACDGARDHGRSLKAAEAAMSASSSPDRRLMLEWIAGLTRAHTEMLLRHQQLQTDLDEARDEFAVIGSALDQASRDSTIDPLTGLHNRLGLGQALAQRVTDAAKGRALTCILIDVDHFKNLNDTYGHPAGDGVLRDAARALLAALRTDDVLGRLGGDEFMAILATGDAAEIAKSAESLLRCVGGIDLARVDRDILGNITVSIGVSTLEPGETMRSLVARADAALYEAKRSGRNRWQLAAPLAPSATGSVAA